MHDHRAPRWLIGGHAQTIWPALFSRRHDGPPPRFARERWDAPDGDFIDVDRLVGEPAARADRASSTASADAGRSGPRKPSEAPVTPPDAPLAVLFHGLEGSSSSHYAQAFAHWARRHRWHCAVPHFRGCSGEINRAARAYHVGDHAEVGWVLERMRRTHPGPLVALGVSLGGNALLRWAEEQGEDAAATVRAVAAVSAPLDLAAGGAAIGVGFNRQVYTRMFLRTMKPKALAKLAQHPGAAVDRERVRRARTIRDFDDAFTAPLHGFRDVADYWTRCSARPHLRRIRIPALLLNARNDPFVPAASLPRAADVPPNVTLWQPPHGGHVGFASGRWPGHVQALPEAVMGWLAQRIGAI